MRDEIKRSLGSFMVLELEALSEALTQYTENSGSDPGEIVEARIKVAANILDEVNAKIVAQKITAKPDHRPRSLGEAARAFLELYERLQENS